MKELAEDIICALAEVYPETPLPKANAHSSFIPACDPIASFGENGETLVFLAFKGVELVPAEPKLEWWHPNIPEWDPQPRFVIPEGWQNEMTAAQRATLQEKSREIAADRLAKFGECVLCGERMAPEHLQDYEENGKLYCADCGNRHLGVVH